MGRGRRTRITAQDIAQYEGGLPALVKQLVKLLSAGQDEAESAAGQLASLLTQGEHCDLLFKAGAIAPLVGLLSRGTATAQASASRTLNALMSRAVEHQRAFVEAGGVGPLVALLKMGSAKVQDDAAAALAAVSDVSHQPSILRAGACTTLVAMLKGSSASGQACAAQALANAAAFPDGQQAIARAGAVPRLLTLLAEGKTQSAAAAALARLAHGDREIQADIAASGGVSPLLALLNSPQPEGQVAAAAALTELTRGNSDTQHAVAKAGGVGPMLELLSNRSASVQSQSMAALAQLAHEHRENQDLIAQKGGVPKLMQVLENPQADPSVLAAASSALGSLIRANAPLQRQAMSLRAVAHLGVLMKSKLSELQAEVAGALWALSETVEVKSQIAAAGTIPHLVSLLGSTEARACAHADACLLSLSLGNEENQVTIARLLIEQLSKAQAEQIEFQSKAQPSAAAAAALIEQSEHAIRTLQALVKANKATRDVIAKAGEPRALVELLRSEHVAVKDFALWSLSISVSEANQATIKEAGGVAPLIAQLSDASTTIKEQAAAALAKLASHHDDNRDEIVKLGGVTPLLALIKTVGGVTAPLPMTATRGGFLTPLNIRPPSPSPTPTEASRRAPTTPHVPSSMSAAESPAPAEGGSVAGRRSPSRGMRRSSVVGPAADASEAEALRQNTVLCLAELATNAAARDEIVSSIRSLVVLLDYKGHDDAMRCNTKRYAAMALARLSRDHEATQSVVGHVGAIPLLVALLNGSEGAEAQEEAAAALLALADCERDRLAITESGGIGWLVRLLGCDNPKAREHAEGALVKLSIENANRVLIIKKLVDMLHESGTAAQERIQEQAAAALANLARESEDNRKSSTLPARSVWLTVLPLLTFC